MCPSGRQPSREGAWGGGAKSLLCHCPSPGKALGHWGWASVCYSEKAQGWAWGGASICCRWLCISHGHTCRVI